MPLEITENRLITTFHADTLDVERLLEGFIVRFAKNTSALNHNVSNARKRSCAEGVPPRSSTAPAGDRGTGPGAGAHRAAFSPG